MFVMPPHVSPSSLLWRVNTSLLSLQNTRMIVPVPWSTTGAGLPCDEANNGNYTRTSNVCGDYSHKHVYTCTYTILILVFSTILGSQFIQPAWMQKNLAVTQWLWGQNYLALDRSTQPLPVDDNHLIIHLSLSCPTLPGWWWVGVMKGGVDPIWEGHICLMWGVFIAHPHICVVLIWWKRLHM